MKVSLMVSAIVTQSVRIGKVYRAADQLPCYHKSGEAYSSENSITSHVARPAILIANHL